MFKIVDIAVLFPSAGFAFVKIFKWMGGDVKLPIFNPDAVPGFIYSFLIIAMTAYWIARAVSIFAKSWGEFVEKKHMNNLHKIRNDRERRNEYVRKSAIYATKEQIAKLNELETKQLKEKEAFLAKIGIKDDTIIDSKQGEDEV
jgi:hypothetical protein